MTKTFGIHRHTVIIAALALTITGVIAILFAMRGPRPTADSGTSPVAQAPSPSVAPAEMLLQYSSRLRGVLGDVVDDVVRGWAVDTAHPGEPVRILFYLEQPRGYGGSEFTFEAVANQVAPRGRDVSEEDAIHWFEAPIPSTMGDGVDHRVYAYALVDGEAMPLPGSPKTFRFYALPPATLSILSPKEGEVLTGSDISIRYEVNVTGSLPPSAHIHWKLDDRPEYHDRDRAGAFLFQGLPPGTHRLTGSLAREHHDKIVNTAVTVTFETREAPLR